MFEVTTKTPITAQQVADLMTTAIEGGSNYWLAFVEPRFNKHEEYSEEASYGPDMTPRMFHADDDEDGCVFDFAAIQKGLQIMAEKYPDHFTDLTQDNADADTGDVFLQCVLFNELVYG